MKVNEYTGMYVVYHNGHKNNEAPFFAISGTSSFTADFGNAFATPYLENAIAKMHKINNELIEKKHCLANKIKVGELCVKEMQMCNS